MSSMLASFPGLSLGNARIEKGKAILSFDCAGADSVVELGGRAMRFEVKAGAGNAGTLCILLDEGGVAEAHGTGRLLLKWEQAMPRPGVKVHIGEAVLALPRQPKPGELPISRLIPKSGVGVASTTSSSGIAMASTTSSGIAATSTTSSSGIAMASTTSSSGIAATSTTSSSGIAATSTTSSSGIAMTSTTASLGHAINSTAPGQKTAIAPVTTRPGLALSSGYIVKLPLWAENKSGTMISITLGTAPSPVSGKLLAPVPAETLRYVSSDILLPADFKPNLRWTSNLLCLKPGETFQFHPDVVTALRAMLSSAQKQGVSGYDLDNSYRSATWQKSLFDRRLSWSKADRTVTDPLATTLRRVARPLGSEHQTGLAFDIGALTGYGSNFAKTANYRWLMAEGWKYGFVVRYPDGWESATKVMFEPWHVRYLGKQIAGYLVAHRIPYEGFVAKVKNQGTVWLGDTEAGPDTVWLAVTATNEAVYASGEDGIGPVISRFLPEQDLWMIPFGNALP